MCCIIACQSKHAPSELIARAVRANSDGSGVCWIDGDKVRWVKGLHTAREIMDVIRDLPLPYAIHTRMATIGGRTDSLSHPFPIDPFPSLDLAGEAPAVLMHNGHHHHWDEMLKAVGHKPKQSEVWSDSRAIAHIVARAGEEVLEVLGESSRFLVMDPDGMRLWGTWIEGDGFKQSSQPAYCSTSTYVSPGFEDYMRRMSRAERRAFKRRWGVTGYNSLADELNAELDALNGAGYEGFADDRPLWAQEDDDNVQAPPAGVVDECEGGDLVLVRDMRAIAGQVGLLG